jgi:poly-gamma-glutamate capsule biosynthesis protein CapA/YwtB (metallophosphatase superfamily)
MPDNDARRLSVGLEVGQSLSGGRVKDNMHEGTLLNGTQYLPEYESQVQTLLKYIAPEEIPASEDLFSADLLEKHLRVLGEPPLSLIAVGDIMLGGRARKALKEHGADYPFAAVMPMLRRASIVLGNLEGPLARKAQKQDRNFSYRVKPRVATSILRAGINVVTLANNHLTDCGREGVLETLEALAVAGVTPLGAAADENAAHRPVIREAGRWRIGLLGYYWNRRCAATANLPGGAMGVFEELETDIRKLRSQVDRVVVTFHWGRPYKLEPSPRARAKAHFAIECGADAVVGHHPHIIQAFEVYCGCPIFYSIGNFAFGSGNSRAEGLMLGFRFEDAKTVVNVHPLYVKNRDPRVNYQPKLLRGNAAQLMLRHLVKISGRSRGFLQIEGGMGKLDLPSRRASGGKREETVA